MTDIAITIGTRLRHFRNEAKLTQEEVAFRAGLHHTYVGQLERGEKNATIESIAKIVAALDISFEDLFRNIIIPTPAAETKSVDECYELIMRLSASEQFVILEILKKIITFKGGL
jgi:transcriptional regulator with XRE-family HTH domain